MARIVFEIIHEHDREKDYRIFDAPMVAIGRGFHNDIILSDPYVSASHAIVRWRDGQWFIEDQSGLNGIKMDNHPIGLIQELKGRGEVITIGKTRVRIFGADHDVSPALPLTTRDYHVLLSKISDRRAAVFIIVMFIVATVVHRYFESTYKISLEELVSSALITFLLTVVWSSVWAFVGRVIKHSFQFLTQLAWSCGVFGLFLLYGIIGSYLEYLLNGMILIQAVDMIVMGGLFVLLFAGHLILSTRVRPRKVLGVLAGIYIALSVVGGSFYLSSRKEFSPDPEFFHGLKPPFPKLISGQSTEKFIKRSDKVFDIEIVEFNRDQSFWNRMQRRY